jgi:hypothetical protein
VFYQEGRIRPLKRMESTVFYEVGRLMPLKRM